MQQTNIVLENQDLRVQIYPARGGKTSSIYHKNAEFEALFQPQDGSLPDLHAGMSFGDADCSGFDDVFPSMGNENYQMNGCLCSLPDHGEIWTTPMAVLAQTSQSVEMACTGTILPYLYTKKITIEKETVSYEISIKNISQQAIPCLWICHCLMNLEEDMTFLFPTSSQIENAYTEPILGKEGTLYNLQQCKYDFSHLPPEGSGIKFYLAGPVSDGCCVAVYPHSKVAVTMTFDPATLPYLGCWITTGAFRGERNFAFEPATGYYDRLSTADRHNRLPILLPEHELVLRIKISVGFYK